MKVIDQENKDLTKPKKSKAVRRAHMLRVDDDDETLEEKLQALEKEAEEADVVATEYHQATVVEDLEEKHRKAREEINTAKAAKEMAMAKAKAKAVAAAREAEDAKR